MISALGKTAKSYNVHKIHSLTVRLLQSTSYIVALDYILCDKDNTFDLTSSKHYQDLSQQYQKNNRDKILDYFMNIKYKVKAEELRF